MKIAMLAMLALVIVLAGAGLFLWTPDRPRAVLEAKYLQSPGDLITVSGTLLHVRDSGPKQAPAVILIHGFGSSLQTWDGWTQALQGAFRVIRLDLPGSGLSAPDPSGDYTDTRTMAILVALMDHLGVAQAALVGNSIGGRIAWSFAAAHPERVTKLVLISPDGYASAGFVYGQQPDVPGMVKLMRYTLPKILLKLNLRPAYGDPSALTDAAVERYHDLMLAPGGRDALIARMQQTVLRDPVPLLHKIQAPVLLVWGSQDAMIPPANAADYQRELAHSELVTLPGLGHVPFEEAPDRSLEPVRAFLQR
jgi:pimeloyl-ACP methyl ester carboxylesterase